MDGDTLGVGGLFRDGLESLALVLDVSLVEELAGRVEQVQNQVGEEMLEGDNLLERLVQSL